MTLSDRARSWADWLTGSGVEPRGAALLYEASSELEAKDAEIARMRNAMLEWQRLSEAADDREVAARRDLAALRAAVLVLPEHKHRRDDIRRAMYCPAVMTHHGKCTCGADAANDALAAARKLAGGEP